MSEVDEYLSEVSPSQRAELERIRKLVKKLAPDASELIGYGIPTYKYKGKNLIHYAAFKDHMSIFPGPLAIENLNDELKNFKQSKGTIQFTLENPIPEKTLKKIIKINIARIDAI